MIKEDKSTIFSQAWGLKSQFPVLPFSLLLTRAWKVQRLREDMRHKVVDFRFLKADGSIREARGTLLKGYAVTVGSRKFTSHKQFATMPYFDIDQDAWRSFKIASLIAVR